MVAKFKKSRKKSYQAIFFSILIGISLLGVVGFLIISNLKISQKRTGLTSKIESLREEIQILEKEKSKLEAGIIQTESETYWEEKLREQGYKKPGEEAVVVLPPENQEEELTEKEKSFWDKLLEKLGF